MRSMRWGKVLRDVGEAALPVVPIVLAALSREPWATRGTVAILLPVAIAIVAELRRRLVPALPSPAPGSATNGQGS